MRRNGAIWAGILAQAPGATSIAMLWSVGAISLIIGGIRQSCFRLWVNQRDPQPGSGQGRGECQADRPDPGNDDIESSCHAVPPDLVPAQMRR